MKVALVSQHLDEVLPPIQNSLGIGTYHLSKQLADKVEVVVYARWNPFRRKEPPSGAVHYRSIPALPNRIWLGLSQFCWPFRKADRPLFGSSLYGLEYVLQVAADLRKQNCDIVHIMNLSQFAPLIRTFNPRCKMVLHMHCQWLTQLDRRMIERRLRKTDLIIGCCDYLTRKIIRRYPLMADRCQTVLNGVDINFFSVDNDLPITLPRENLSKGNKNILFVGRISPEKGVHTLLSAWQRVVERCPEAHLHLVGPREPLPAQFIVKLSEDEKVADLAQFYEEEKCLTQILRSMPRGIAHKVSFAGVVPHSKLVDFYREADVFVNASYSEGLPLPILEAMACSLPVVATSVGGIPEAVVPGQTGLLVEPGDANSLADTLLRLLQDDDLRLTMGRNARRRAVELFSWKHHAEEVLSHYRALLGT